MLPGTYLLSAGLPVVALGLRSSHASVEPATACTSFAGSLDLKQYNTTVVNSTYFAAGEYVVPGVSTGFYIAPNVSNDVPFCQIYTNVAYGKPGDELLFTIWLPSSENYQERFLAVGDGGLAGTIDTLSMLANLNLGFGFAIAGGNGGHTAAANNDGAGAPGVYLPFLHDLDQVQAWIHDGISLFTPAAKAIVGAKYGNPKYSYYVGCSTGGAQGYALAQLHPTLFDGIVASSPGNYYSHLALSFLWNFVHANSSAGFIPQNQLTAMTDAVVAACGDDDGTKDGVIGNPLDCRFDVASFACDAKTPSLNSSTCLTPAQLQVAETIYQGPVRTDTRAQIYPGFAFGSESSWLYQEAYLADAFSIPILQNLVHDNLSYNASTFNFGSDVNTVDAKAGRYIDEIDPDLSAYHDRGGKLLSIQGWADPLNSPFWPIEHLAQVQAASGGDVSAWYELFMSPGAGHCGANPAYPKVPGTYASTAAMVAWVEGNVVPTQIEASQPPSGANVTKKLCPFPKVAKYVSGDVSDWTSFACELP